MNILLEVSQKLNITEKQVEIVLKMLFEGSTIPFIARYRKEVTNGLDENQIKAIEVVYKKEKNLEERKETILKLLNERKMLTTELQNEIKNTENLRELEDIYLPYKEKRKTKASEAKKQGLEPLAKIILHSESIEYIDNEATKYLNHVIQSEADAIAGAKYIISENIAEKAENRQWIRHYIYTQGEFKAKYKKKGVDEKEVFKTYYNFVAKINTIANYQILAINRGEKLKILTISFVYNVVKIIELLTRNNQKMHYKNNQYVFEAIEDGFKRLIKPPIEREIRSELTERAGEGAISIFATNLENLLLTPAIKNKTILGIDPGFRTGCKIAIINGRGEMKLIDVIYLFKENQAFNKFDQFFKEFKIDVIVIGNGTASRETTLLVNKYLNQKNLKIPFTIISEAGASVYSASKIAQDEFPDLQVEQRSAVSIARRYQDALNELVKIEPKAIGIGQYQHDVNQKKLEDNLNFTVEKIVNQVGVDINTASIEILKYVAGISAKVAKNIIAYRHENGDFKKRSEIKKIKGLGLKTYEQAIGFLRIINGLNKLDSTPIHPESYQLAKNILEIYHIKNQNIGDIDVDFKFDIAFIMQQFDSDKYTIQTIIDGIIAPNRDIRDSYNAPLLRMEINSIDNINVGDILEGRIQNVTDFGAFVDIGIKESGLIHKSNLSSTYVSDPLKFIAIGEIVEVKIISIEKIRKRIGLQLIKKVA